MANSCGGADGSVPDDIERELKAYLKKHKPRAFFDATDQNGDMKYSCLLEDLGGARCPKGKCRYNHDENPSRIDKSTKPIT